MYIYIYTNEKSLKITPSFLVIIFILAAPIFKKKILDLNHQTKK